MKEVNTSLKMRIKEMVNIVTFNTFTPKNFSIANEVIMKNTMI